MTQRLALALGAFVIWTVITVLVGKLLAGGETSLLEGVSHGIGWAWVMAAGFILAIVVWQGWSDVGLNRGADAAGVAAGLAADALHLVALGVCHHDWPAARHRCCCSSLINCLFVGFSEELMFRGALLQAFRHAVRSGQRLS